MASSVLLFLAGVGATYAFLRALVWLTQDPKEPPPVCGTVPFLSPAMSMATEKANFFVQMRNKHPHLPIYTLRGLGPRLYIVNSLHLMQRIDRLIHAIAFSPIEVRVVDKAMGMSQEGVAKTRQDMLSDTGYMMGFSRFIAPAASPGPGLDALNRAGVETFAASFDRLAAQGRTELDLYGWIRHEFFMAMTQATYGPHNPFRLPENEKAWFTFEPGIMPLLLGILPGVLARRFLEARDRMAAEFKSYFRQDRHLDGSLLVQLRLQHNKNHGISVSDTAYTEIGQVAAKVSNTVPSAFWATWQILADPVVFEDCRREVSQLVQTDPDGLCTMDLTRIQTACPILASTWQECLRFHGISISARVVQEDIVVDGQYLLKKGSLVMMSNGVLHSDESLWGPTAGHFNHKRFLRSNKDGPRRAPAAAFRGFGGGTVLCPGRYFASTQILAFVALLLVRFDVRPVEGRWVEPIKDSIMNAAFPLPKNRVKIELVPKDCSKWRVVFSGNDKDAKVAAEDALAGDE